MEIKITATAFMMSHQRLEGFIAGRDTPIFSLYPEHMPEGCTEIGVAEIALKLHTSDAIVRSQVEALNKQLHTLRAKHQQEQSAILEELNKLQALTA